MKGIRTMLRAAALGLAAILAAPVLVAAQGIVNGDFETGDFTGWTVLLHQATAPLDEGGGDKMVGAQVLTGDDFFRDGAIQPGVLPPSGVFMGFISSTPGGTELPCMDIIDPQVCPITRMVQRNPPTNVDSDCNDSTDPDFICPGPCMSCPYIEFDTTSISQEFVVTQVPARLSFVWSYLNSERPDEFHDDLHVVLTPVNPPGPDIQVLGLTAGNPNGNPFNQSYTGTFEYIPFANFDTSTYEVITDPPGGPADCFYGDQGRTPFQTTVVPIPSPGVWRVTFYVGDDGGDACMDSGAIIDDVRVSQGAAVPAMSDRMILAAALLLLAVGAVAVARGRKRRAMQHLCTVIAGVLLAGSLLLVQPATGAVPSTGSDDPAFAAGEEDPGLIQEARRRRTPRRPTRNPTRRPTPPPTPSVTS
ncbi:hypothetical protein L6Q96_03915 [Candidatus Binatia bacterium]|nr:hypothetical protein [Candidatus Binatia bacterium]